MVESSEIHVHNEIVRDRKNGKDKTCIIVDIK